MTIGTVKGIQIHDQREKEFSHTNPDIDFSKSDLNEDLYNSKNINYNQEIKNKIKELNLTRAVRKDAIVMCQSLITSDKSFFDKLSSQEQNQFFKDSFEFIKETYGEKNIISANVHYDEKTPHMHINFVPITKDGRLCAKDLFKRVDLIKLHDNFSKHCKEHGYDLERGESKGNLKKHLSVEEYKLETKGKEIEKIKTELNKTHDRLKNDFETVKDVKTNIWHLEHLEKKNSLIGAKTVVKTEDYNKLVDMAKQGVYTLHEMRELKEKNINLNKDNNRLTKSYFNSKNRNNELEKENTTLQKGTKELKKQHKVLIDTLDSHNLLPEANKRLKTIREKESEKISRRNKRDYLER
jgi:Plasmid recombination enzyme